MIAQKLGSFAEHSLTNIKKYELHIEAGQTVMVILLTLNEKSMKPSSTGCFFLL